MRCEAARGAADRRGRVRREGGRRGLFSSHLANIAFSAFELLHYGLHWPHWGCISQRTLRVGAWRCWYSLSKSRIALSRKNRRKFVSFSITVFVSSIKITKSIEVKSTISARGVAFNSQSNTKLGSVHFVSTKRIIIFNPTVHIYLKIGGLSS